jgi:hypothetical protein
MITAREAVMLLMDREKEITDPLSSIDTTTEEGKNKFNRIYYSFSAETEKLQAIGEIAAKYPEYRRLLEDLRKTYPSFLKSSYDCFGIRELVAIGIAYKAAEKIIA